MTTLTTVLKKIPAYSSSPLILALVLIMSILVLQPLPALGNRDIPGFDEEPSLNQISQNTITQPPEQRENPSHLVWIIGEIALVVITVVILLAFYSWHLRAVVSKKTKELKQLNEELEFKVEERTAELKKMYTHAEEERKRTKVALESEREAIKQNSNFIDMISHEYRTPLSVISSSIELISKKCELNHFRLIDDQIKKMSISTRRLVDIFDSSLDPDRLDTLGSQLQISTMNLVSIIYQAIELVKTVYVDYQIILINKSPEDIMILGDKKLLVTVFKNILDNACKYSNPDVPISIQTNSCQNHVEVVIIDSGMGIDKDEIEFVLEKYYRSEYTGEKQGVGLGLFLVKTIVELHKGDVKLESQRHIGTKVSVCLPK